MCWTEPFLSLNPLGPLQPAVWRQPPPARMGQRAAVFTCAFPPPRPVPRRTGLLLSSKPSGCTAAPAPQRARPGSGLFPLRAGTAALTRSRSRSENWGDEIGSNWSESVRVWVPGPARGRHWWHVSLTGNGGCGRSCQSCPSPLLSSSGVLPPGPAELSFQESSRRSPGRAGRWLIMIVFLICKILPPT